MPRRRPSEEVRAVNCLLGKGLSDYEIGRRTGISRSSVQRWRTIGIPRQDCSRPSKWRPADPHSYCYLLGIYLGDGYLSKASSRSQVLEISLDPRYPAIVDECLEAIQRTVEAKPRASRRTTPKGEAIRLVATSPLWRLAFPQHGTGKLQRLFCASCDQLAIRWTRSSYKNISVADRRSVTLLDSFVGPKN